MKEYEFTLKFSLQDTSSNPENYIDSLNASGCDDALVGIGQTGRIALNFTRESMSANKAISSALADVKKAIPNAKLIEATPDFVGLTDVAELLGFTRQNMRKLMVTSGAEFPMPVHEGKSALWHLATILLWLTERKTYKNNIQETLVEIAEANMQINLAKEIRSMGLKSTTDIDGLIAKA